MKSISKLFLHILKIGKIIGSLLIDIVIEPVGIEDRGIASPSQSWQCTGIVSGEIVIGHVGVQTFVDITKIFVIKSISVIFGMTEYKELSAVFVGNDGSARNIGRGKNFEFIIFLYIRTVGYIFVCRNDDT